MATISSNGSRRLLPGNPAKVDTLRALGVEVVSRVPVLVPSNPFSKGYVETNRERMRHAIPASIGEASPEIAELALASNDAK